MTGRWCLLAALSAALPVGGLGGCNGRIVFMDRHGTGGSGGATGLPEGGAPDASTDALGPGDGGGGGDRNDADGAVDRDDDSRSDGQGGDRQADGGNDGGNDAPPEAAAPDVPPPVDGGSDDAAKDSAVDASDGAVGPIVCTQDTNCKLGLHCLVPSGQPGSCVECTVKDHCKRAGAPYCDLTLNRCVECLIATDCPSSSTGRPSACKTATGRCLLGCDDDGTVVCPTTTRSLTCQDSTHLCAECQVNADCASSPFGTLCHPSDFICVRCLPGTCTGGQICDPLTGNCVGCQTSKDCRTPGLPLCDPATLTCVAVP